MRISIAMGVDTADLVTDMRRAQREVDKRTKEMQKAARAAGVAIGAALAAGATAAAYALKKAIDRADELSKTAQKIGVTTEALSRLEYAAGRSGLSLGQLATGVGKLSQNMAAAVSGNTALAGAFDAIGVSVTRADGSLRNADDVLLDLADVFQKLPDGADQTALAMQLMGKSGRDMIPLLNGGSKAITELTDRAEQLGLVVTTTAGQQAEAFNDALGDLVQTALGVANSVGAELVPQLTAFAEQINSPAFRDGIGSIITGAVNATAALVGMVAELGNVARFAGEEVAARINGPSPDDIRRLKLEYQDLFAELSRLNAAEANDAFGSSVSDEYKQGIVDRMSAIQELIKQDEIWRAQRQQSGQEQAAADEADIGALEVKTSAVGDLLARLQEYYRSLQTGAGVARENADAERDSARALQDQVAAWDAALRASQEFYGIAEDLRTELAGPSAQAQATYQRRLREIAELARIAGVSTADLAAVQQDLRKQFDADSLGALRDQLSDIKSDSKDFGRDWKDILADLSDTPISGLVDDIELMEKALESATDPEHVNELKAAIGQLRGIMREGLIDTSIDALRSLQSMSQGGSDAFRAMQVAIDALTVVQAISAVLNQGNGDPYTAFARMAAMAAAVASLGVSVGGLAGGFGDVAQARQDTQGTGSVLGDATADSASILNAMEITANATSQLVGINRSMLNALTAMQAGLTGASTLLARGAGDADFAAPGAAPLNFATRASNAIANVTLFGGFLGGLLDSISRSILGARSKITDTGLLIGGGMLTDLLDGITVSAYQEVSSRSWWFGSTHTNTDTQALGDDVAAQFQLVLNSIAEAVRGGAAALGMSAEAIDAAIAAYQIEEIRISTMDLSPEEAQAELEAVFGKIFDGLAGSVVPFIGQFQQVGEGLGETLVRVATGVQVTQEAVRQLGFSLGETDPEKFAQISEGLIEMAGGIDAFIGSMSDFVNAFAPESHKFEVAQTALNTAFAEAGLVLPATREGMWDLMQSMDATTESGQKQIATLLRLAGTADSYYSTLEQRESERLSALAEYANAVGDIDAQIAALEAGSEFQASLRDIATEYNDNVAALNEAAQAAGLAAAREQDLAKALKLATIQRQRAIAALQAEGQQLAQSLGYTALSGIDAQIAALQAQEDAATSAVQSFGDAMGDAASSAMDAINLLLGDLSPYKDREKLAMALQAQQQGLVGPEDVLRIAQRLFASGTDYNQVFAQVMAIGDRRSSGSVGGYSGGAVASGVSPEMQALLDERAAMVAEQEAAQRRVQAGDLAQIIADIAGAQGITFAEAAEQLGIADMSALAGDLGVTMDALSDYLTALQADSYSIEDIAGTITAGDQAIIDALFELFGDPSTGGGLRSNAISDLQPDADGKVPISTDEPLPIEPAPIVDPIIEHGDRVAKSIEDGNDALIAEVQALNMALADLLARVASNTDALPQMAGIAAATQSAAMAAAPRSKRLPA